MDAINRLLESMSRAKITLKDSGAINTAADFFDNYARQKADRTNSQTVWGDLHAQFGIEMDIKLLEEAIIAERMNPYDTQYLAGMDKALRLIKKQLIEYPWY